MASDDDLIPLDQWSTLVRQKAIVAIDAAIEFIKEGKGDDALVILELLSTRFAVDQSVEEFFHHCEQLEGGKYFELCQ